MHGQARLTGRWSVPALAAVLVLAGCGGPDGAAPQSTPTPTTASSPPSTAGATPTPSPTRAPSPTPTPAPAATGTPVPAAEARRMFDRAVDRLLDGDTGRIRMNARAGPGSVVTESRFRLSSRMVEARIGLVQDGEEGAQVSTIALGDRSWFRVDHRPGQSAQTCWTAAGEQVLTDTTGLRLPTGGGGYPPAVAVLLLARARSGTTTTVDADVNVFLLTQAVQGGLAQLLDLDPRTDATATIHVSVLDGRVTAWGISFGDVLRAAKAAGGAIPAGAEDDLDDPRLGGVLAQFYDLGDPVDLVPPPGDRVVAYTGDAQAYADAAAACESR